MLQKNKKGKETFSAVDVSDNRRTERTHQKCFRCGYEDHIIAKFPKLPKDNENRQKKVCLMKKVIGPATKVKTTVTKRYMHLLHVCLAMTNVQVKIMVKVCN